jgi:hypothetical protein
MTRDREEKIMMLAYGELGEAEARQVLSWVETDPEARRVYETYGLAASATKTLPAPPPHQLSAERLREAILDRQLSRPAYRPFAFGGAALAGLGCLFALAVIFNGPAPSDEVATNADTNKPEAMISNPIDSSDNPDFVVPTVAQEDTEPQLAPEKPRAKRTPPPKDLVASTESQPNLPSASMQPIEGGIVALSADSANYDIVLIAPSEDNLEGVSDAKEVRSLANVALGG